MHPVQIPAVQFEQIDGQQYPDTKEYPGLQDKQLVAEHEAQPVEQLLHPPNNRVKPVLHTLQSPDMQFKQFDGQQYPDTTVYPIAQIEQLVADEHVKQFEEQGLHTPNER